MNKKPNIFKPNMEFIDTNKKAYCSYLEEPSIQDEEIENDVDVLTFLNKLSNSGSYVFNKRVVIVTNNRTYDTRIAGKMGNRLITLDNDSININDIKKIYEKKIKVDLVYFLNTCDICIT